MTEIDTSGDVGGRKWSDLSPFTQGYIEELFASEWANGRDLNAHHLGFSDIAPETLARIIADCAAWLEGLPGRYKTRQQGKAFWSKRQASHFKKDVFPALTVQLGDDGKVRFAA